MKIEGIEILNDEDLEIALKLKFSRAARMLGLSNNTIQKHNTEISKDVDLIHQGKKPSVIVAVRLYKISQELNEKRSQEQIAILCDVSTAGMRGTYNTIKEEIRGF